MTESRFMDKVELIPFTTCWIWTGAVVNRSAPKLIPALKIEGKVVNARRVSFELFIGEIWDETLRVVAKCGTDLCVNPEHVDIVTPYFMTVAGRQTSSRKARVRTHFGCGHLISMKNTIFNSKRERHCRECNKVQKRIAKRAKAKRPQPYRWLENKVVGIA